MTKEIKNEYMRKNTTTKEWGTFKVIGNATRLVVRYTDTDELFETDDHSEIERFHSLLNRHIPMYIGEGFNQCGFDSKRPFVVEYVENKYREYRADGTFKGTGTTSEPYKEAVSIWTWDGNRKWSGGKNKWFDLNGTIYFNRNAMTLKDTVKAYAIGTGKAFKEIKFDGHLTY